jgi:hypothetical protein
MEITQTIPSTKAHRHQSTGFRWGRAMIALLCGAAGLALAMHYPVAPWVALLAFVVASVAFFRWPDSWLFVVPALLPVVGFAPWTGWITFEELDMLVLAAAVGGYARSALPVAYSPDKGRRGHRISPGSLLLLILFALSTLIAMVRGIEDAGGFVFGWYQGYHEPMNSVPLAKSFFLALLVLPLWWYARSRRGNQASVWLTIGITVGLALAALTTLWERAAFVGIFDFSADYRTTGLFWEMHVGGAALDGFLTITIPFAVREVFVARSTLRWGIGAACLGLAGYAALTTFSRGVFVSVPIAMAITLACCIFSARRQVADPSGGPASSAQGKASLLPGLVLVVIFTAAIWFTFPSSGYRGLLALLGAMAVAMPLSQIVRAYKASDWAVALLAALALAGLVFAAAWLIPKGAYLAYGFSLVLSLVILGMWQMRRAPPSRRRGAGGLAQMAFAGFVAVLTGAVLVAQHWGTQVAMGNMLLVAMVLLVLLLATAVSPRSLWPDSYRWQSTVLGMMVMAGGALGVMGGGSYMTERFSTTGGDMDVRLAHWRDGWNMLTSPLDPILGKGLGRYPASYFFSSSSNEHPGDYRLVTKNGEKYLVLGGGKQAAMGWGEILRVSQRIQAPSGPVTVSLVARTTRALNLHVEVCEKHLLYNAGCMLGQTGVAAKPGEWQEVRIPMAAREMGGSLIAPRLVVFSIATDTALGVVDIDRIRMTDSRGSALLDNGDFTEDMRRWFFSSDRNHLPWHIKNVLMNVLFDQGFVGLLLFAVMGLTAFWRVSLGNGRDHPLAPGIAGALVGFVVVGAFDSLLDVPRLAFLFYFMLMLGLTIRQGKPKRADVMPVAAPPASRHGRDPTRRPASPSPAPAVRR